MHEAGDNLPYPTGCAGCGDFMDHEAPGHPRYCSAECAEARGAAQPRAVPKVRTIAQIARKKRKAAAYKARRKAAKPPHGRG